MQREQKPSQRVRRPHVTSAHLATRRIPSSGKLSIQSPRAHIYCVSLVRMVVPRAFSSRSVRRCVTLPLQLSDRGQAPCPFRQAVNQNATFAVSNLHWQSQKQSTRTNKVKYCQKRRKPQFGSSDLGFAMLCRRFFAVVRSATQRSLSAN